MSGAALFHPPQLLLLTTAHTTRHSAYGGRKWKCGSTAPSVRRLRRKPKIATVPSPQAAARQVTTGTQLGSGALLNAGCERCTSAAATCAYRRSTLVRNPTGQGFSQAQCAARHRAVAVLQGTRRALQVPPLTALRTGPRSWRALVPLPSPAASVPRARSAPQPVTAHTQVHAARANS